MRSFQILTTSVCALMATGIAGGAQSNLPSGSSNATLVYIGTHTGAKSKGIYLFRLQPTGAEVFQNVTLIPLGLAAETPNPTYLELDLKRRLLFAVNEAEEGTISSFSIDPAGKLTLLNQRPTKGSRPCYLVLDKEGRNLLVTNCGSGSIAVLPVALDGQLGEATAVQSSKKAACAVFDPAGQFAFACDSGSDKILAYKFDAEKGKLTEAASASVKEGSGPRRMLFRPDGMFAYVLNEKTSTVSVFAYDSKTGTLTEVQSLSTLPGYWEGTNTTAELGMHPSGKYLFASNNGHNSVVLFEVDAEKGTLTYIEEQGTGGVNPRNFGIQPSGQHLAIANHDSDKVLASRIDGGNGRLKPSGIFAEVPSPACVKFLPPPSSGR